MFYPSLPEDTESPTSREARTNEAMSKRLWISRLHIAIDKKLHSTITKQIVAQAIPEADLRFQNGFFRNTFGTSDVVLRCTDGRFCSLLTGG